MGQELGIHTMDGGNHKDTKARTEEKSK